MRDEGCSWLAGSGGLGSHSALMTPPHLQPLRPDVVLRPTSSSLPHRPASDRTALGIRGLPRGLRATTFYFLLQEEQSSSAMTRSLYVAQDTDL